MFDTRHKEDALQNLLQKKYDLYGEHAVFHIIKDKDLEEAKRRLKFTADWFEHPHPDGRDLRGESDFTAIRLICGLYEEACYDKLDSDTKASMERFFLRRDFSSIYGSENHALMFRASRLLAAQFYQGKFFENYGMSAEECYRKDMEYLHDFLDFRAGRGWGEFDSLGYAMEIMIILGTVHRYVRDAGLKNKCHMAMDIILLDMIADSLDDLYGGAHGRCYPDGILNRVQAPMDRLYRYYFGGKFYDGKEMDSVNLFLSDYLPSPIVYHVAENKKMPWENRERKHLHCMSAWMGEEINWEELKGENGSINKYTYVCEDYCIGAVNHQDPYSETTDPEDRGYAKHQQHEWELTLPGGSEHLIFSHHFAEPDYHKINNRWTGDHDCCCGSFFCDPNTVVAMYNIEERQGHKPLINAFVNLKLFGEILKEEKYLFLCYNNIYIFLYFDNGYEINEEDEYAGKELRSKGWQNAVVLRVACRNDYASLQDFAKKSKAVPVLFDRDARKVMFDGIEVRENGNSKNGVENHYPYPKTYDCPFLQSEWDSRMIEVTCGEEKVVYDFKNNCMG